MEMQPRSQRVKSTAKVHSTHARVGWAELTDTRVSTFGERPTVLELGQRKLLPPSSSPVRHYGILLCRQEQFLEGQLGSSLYRRQDSRVGTVSLVCVPGLCAWSVSLVCEPGL